MEKAKLERLKAMHALACELTREPDKQIDGDLHIVEALLADKLRYLKPEEFYKHVRDPCKPRAKRAAKVKNVALVARQAKGGK